VSDPTPEPPPSYFRNWLSLAGTVLALSAFFAFVLLLAVDMLAHQGNPYMGILAYVVAPGFLLLGLGMIAAGAWLHRRHLLAAAPDQPLPNITIDLGRPADRRRLLFFTTGSALFLMLTAFGSFQTYHYTESVQFCGQVCHVPMKPEFVTYQISPHARVDCVRCHVGDGAGAFVKAKLNGVNQLIGVITGDYHHPIKPPTNLRPAQEICEQCHWSQRQVGRLDRTYTHFLADETNTPFSVRLSLNVGGGEARGGAGGGIHWHMNLDNKVEYIATGERAETIPWVRVTDATGKVTEFASKDFKDDPAKHSIKRMDCMDCHNRPAHNFLPPNDAVDLAMASGRVDPTIPWVKSNLVEVLTQTYTTESDAHAKISDALKTRYPGQPKLEAMIAETQRIFSQNFFPEMKADWRAYPDHISHKNSAGCFRCHDGEHKTADRKHTLKASDCNSCHVILAQGAGEELEKLNPKGHNFFHLDSEYSDFSCHNCHTGAFPK
jgi:hypothetical protein